MFDRIVNATLANNSLHLHQKLATFPGMFEDIPQNVLGDSLDRLVTFLGMFGDILLNVWGHSPEWLSTFSEMFEAYIRLFVWWNVCLYVCEMFVWCIASIKSLNKVENLQKWALHFLHNEYSSSYDDLLKKSGRNTVNVSNYRSLCTEIFEILNDINPSFIKYIFMLRMTNGSTREKCKLNIEIPKSNQVRFE